MISLLLSDPRAGAASPPPEPTPEQTREQAPAVQIAPTVVSPPPAAVQAAEEAEEFEIVVGRRQIASISLVVVVLLAVFCGVSYSIGKSAGHKSAAPAPAPVAATPASVPMLPVADLSLPRTQRAGDTESSGSPLFAEPVPGAVYIQVGAVEKGVAQIWAEGLRTHGLKAFVAPGLSDRIFRVLVGPMPSPDAYQYTRDALDRIGLETFGRKYQL